MLTRDLFLFLAWAIIKKPHSLSEFCKTQFLSKRVLTLIIQNQREYKDCVQSTHANFYTKKSNIKEVMYKNVKKIYFYP